MVEGSMPLRFGLNIFKNDRVGYYANKENISATLGIAGLPPKPPLAWGMPNFNLSNGITSGLGSRDPFVTRDTTFQWMDNPRHGTRPRCFVKFCAFRVGLQAVSAPRVPPTLESTTGSGGHRARLCRASANLQIRLPAREASCPLSNPTLSQCDDTR
jgi:hypothetical protein